MNETRSLLFLSEENRGAAQLGGVVQELLEVTQSSRTTVRLCRQGGEVELVAEARREGVPSMVDIRPEGIRAAGTYTFLETTGQLLIQNDCRSGEPAPPPSLVDELHVYAQMLAPVAISGEMVATISVHQQGRTRTWSDADLRALRAAQNRVKLLLQSAGIAGGSGPFERERSSRGSEELGAKHNPDS